MEIPEENGQNQPVEPRSRGYATPQSWLLTLQFWL
jgi:hypothetical protein